MARVFEVMRRTMSPVSMLYVFGSISQKTGFAPTYKMVLPEATNVNGEVMTSSPAFIPAAMSERCSPAVPLDTAHAYFTPSFFANAFSNRSIKGPILKMPERSTCST